MCKLDEESVGGDLVRLSVTRVLVFSLHTEDSGRGGIPTDRNRPEYYQ